MIHLLSELSSPLDSIANLGVAGLMGAMWLWERRTSQKRETQIDEAHARILGDRVQLEQLMAVVRQNAEAVTRLSSLQDQLLRELTRNERRET
jgi:hypothetical protein